MIQPYNLFYSCFLGLFHFVYAAGPRTKSVLVKTLGCFLRALGGAKMKADKKSNEKKEFFFFRKVYNS